jgi:short-subunit dehydrogenase
MIVAISSIQGKIGVPYHTGYSASKHALQGFLEALRLEENLPILIVSPSWIAGTELKEKALLSNGRRKHGNRGLSLRECVTRILSAMESRKRDLFLPRSYRMLLWLQLLSPRFLGTVIQKAVRK